MEIVKEAYIKDIIKNNTKVIKFFEDEGMHCTNCPSANGETVEQACDIHDIDCDAFIAKLKNFLDGEIC